MHKFLLLFPAFLMGLLPAHPQSDSEKEPDFTGHFSARTYTLARFYWQESPYAPYQQQGEMRLAANGKWAFKKASKVMHRPLLMATLPTANETGYGSTKPT
jgi:hypothetical protein